MEESISKLTNRAEIHSIRNQKNKESEAKATYKTTSSRLKFTFYCPRRKRKADTGRKLFEEIMIENFPNLRKETAIQI